MKSVTCRLPILTLAAAMLLWMGQPTSAQTVDTTTVPSWVGNLPFETVDTSTFIPAGDPIWTDPNTTDSATTNPVHLPRGSVYKLFGSAKNTSDPQNPFNDVISFDTTSTTAVAGAVRLLGDHVQVMMLTNQIELKYLLIGRICGGGSPRIQLAIDGDGDGNFKQTPGGPDQNAFGYLGDSDGFQTGNCAQAVNHWFHEDMTDAAPKWGLDQWAASGKPPVCDAAYLNCRWDEVVRYFQTNWPNHRVLNAVLVDDASGNPFPAGRGCAYFDLVNTGARTYTNHEDATGGGQQPNNCGP